MTKIVLNNSYGGFGLSHAAMLRLAQLKGIDVYPEHRYGYYIYWLEPIAEGKTRKNGKTFEAPDRTDPDLVRVVEELGSEANDDYSDLVVSEIPSGTLYRICEYDGKESIEYADRVQWRMA